MFNEDLNRFTLKVKNLEAARAKVTWGEESKECSREQLTAGVNLAALFSRTPFDNDFRNVVNAVAAKQNFETTLIKSFVTSFRSFSNETKNDPDLAGAFKTAAARLMVHQQELDAAVRKAIVPVQHTLTVAPLP